MHERLVLANKKSIKLNSCQLDGVNSILDNSRLWGGADADGLGLLMGIDNWVAGMNVIG